MAARVRWTESAWKDLESVADYISRDSPRYAASFVREIREAVRSLNKMARRGRVVPELGDREVRELLIGNYRLIYRIAPESVEVLAIIHGAGNLKSLWEKEGRSNP